MPRLVRHHRVPGMVGWLALLLPLRLLSPQTAPTACAPPVADTMRATLYLSVRTTPEDIPLDRKQLLLQELAFALPPSAELPLVLPFGTGPLSIDRANVTQLAPWAAIRFELFADGQLRDIELPQLRPTWMGLELQALLLETARRLDTARTLGGVLFGAGRSSLRVELRLTTTPAPDAVSRPIARVSIPYVPVDVSPRLLAEIAPPRYPMSLRVLNLRDTVRLLVTVSPDGRIVRSKTKLLQASSREFVEVVGGVLSDLRFAPARSGGCAVSAVRELTYIFIGGRVTSVARLDVSNLERWEPAPRPRSDAAPAAYAVSRSEPGRRCATRVERMKAPGDGWEMPEGVDAGDVERLVLALARAGVRLEAPKGAGRSMVMYPRGGVRATLYRAGGLRMGGRGDVVTYIEGTRIPADGRQAITSILDAAGRDSLELPLSTAAFHALVHRDGVDVREDTTAYFDFELEQPTIAKSGNPAPRYPAMLQSRGVDGELLIQFVIDTTGRADMSTFRVLRSTDPLFTTAVLEVLPRYRFQPAERDGCKVRMYVQIPFTFQISRE